MELTSQDILISVEVDGDGDTLLHTEDCRPLQALFPTLHVVPPLECNDIIDVIFWHEIGLLQSIATKKTPKQLRPIRWKSMMTRG
jgi:hypothetical protein